jgi:hypothetical protein
MLDRPAILQVADFAQASVIPNEKRCGSRMAEMIGAKRQSNLFEPDAGNAAQDISRRRIKRKLNPTSRSLHPND